MVQLDDMKAAIFDLDGLMIESESIAHQVLSDVLGKYGKTIASDIYQNLIGRDPLESID
jgi:beta-phosphoglucomutase-like phosphatase (HAD superfamily)